MSTAGAALSVEPASVIVVVALVAVARFWKHQDKKKRLEKEELLINVFGMWCQQFIYVLAFFISNVHVKQYMHHSGGCTINRIAPGIKATSEAFYKYEKKGGRAGGSYVNPPVPNGPILGSACLGCALRYFAGRLPYNIMVKYGLCYQDVFARVWIVVHAINTFPAFQIGYSVSVVEQENIAEGFESASTVGFDYCAEAIDMESSVGCSSLLQKRQKKPALYKRNFYAAGRTSLD
jgi:hypothetical protein